MAGHPQPILPTPLPPEAPPAFHIMAKPSGSACNLDCKYCFYLSKGGLYPDSNFRMTDELVELYIKQLLESHRAQEVTIAWQGGEPTLLGIDFFKRSIELVQKYKKPAQKVLHTIQMNGTLIDANWAAFFKEHHFLVGLSIDGPKPMHNAYRVNKSGAGSFDAVMRGWESLQMQGVDVNILCALHADNAGHPLEVYRFFRDDLKAQYIQFIPIIERATRKGLPLANQGWSEHPGGERPLYIQAGNQVTERSVKPKQFGRFLIAVFNEWMQRDIGKVFVQMFDAALGSWMGINSLCIFAPTCGDALALEHNGDLYACDHFVEPGYLLGNIQETHLIELVASQRQRKFGQDKLTKLPHVCLECPVRFACHGGCPKDRFLRTQVGEPGLNYLCAGYKLFYNHIKRSMVQIADLLRTRRDAKLV